MRQHLEPVYVEEYMIAPAGVRFGNLFIDVIVQAVIAYVIGLLSVVAGEVLGWDSLYIWFRQMDKGDTVFFLLTIHVLYYIFFEGIFGRTPGKMVTGTMVVTIEGGKPGFVAVLTRSFCRLIPLEGISFFGEKVWGLHDRLSDTYVVDVTQYRRGQALQKELKTKNKIAGPWLG